MGRAYPGRWRRPTEPRHRDRWRAETNGAQPAPQRAHDRRHRGSASVPAGAGDHALAAMGKQVAKSLFGCFDSTCACAALTCVFGKHCMQIEHLRSMAAVREALPA
eukprot:CAMPEP_0170392282 /NCGR_PEP_ID=MMETSP0117_2-20130122/20108_1 /TAXON_ID=400756 /ORGANISM="Durinskia baltica, Strain CSIRO CS-38" /LENGTH=105 /DNA_ID=CAMNT_0010648407 /DNA_START=49 /DNA_END=363 /DNA_ORIENTATION=-